MLYKLTALLIFTSIVASLAANARPLFVMVDPGHGGSDTGATVGGLRESQIVLNISKELLLLLDSNKNFIASTTRADNRIITLDERTAIAEKKNADLFVSIHANSSPISSARGVEIYFQNQMPADEESLYLADRENAGAALQTNSSNKPKGDLAAILDDLRRQNQIYLSANLATDVYRAWTKYPRAKIHIRQAPFHVLSDIKIPSILVETGFITNAQDARLLAKVETQKEIAQILYEGLLSYRKRWSSESR